MKKLLLPIAVACCVAVLPTAAAQAYTTTDKGWTNYVGKTKEGSKISFAYRKGVISIISTMVPSTCASGQGGTPRARMSSFDPPQSVIFRVNGRESQTKVTEPWPERYYTVTASKKGKRLVGRCAQLVAADDGHVRGLLRSHVPRGWEFRPEAAEVGGCALAAPPAARAPLRLPPCGRQEPQLFTPPGW